MLLSLKFPFVLPLVYVVAAKRSVALLPHTSVSTADEKKMNTEL